MTTLKQAMTTLGIKGTVRATYIQADRIMVCVNGEYFGIWDSERNTFVD